MFTKTYGRGLARRSLSLVAAGALTATLSVTMLGVGGAHATAVAPEAAQSEQSASSESTASAIVYQKTSYAPDLFRVDTATKAVKRLTFAEWAQAGYPKPTVVPAITGTKFMKIEASDRVFAVVGDTSTEMTFEGWKAAGYPTPQVVAALYVKYTGWDSVYAVSFVTTDKNEWIWVQLTFDEWVRAKQPTPQPADWITGSRYFHNTNSVTDERYPMVLLFEGKYMWLERWAWEDAGSPVPEGNYGGPTQVQPW